MRADPAEPVHAAPGDRSLDSRTVPRRRSRPTRAISSIVLLPALAALAAALLAGCGGGGGSSSSHKAGATTTTANGPGASQLAAAESAQFCRGLGTGGCQSLNATVEGWLQQGHLDAHYAVGALGVASSGCLNCHEYRGSGSPPQRSKAPDLTHIGGARSQAQIAAVIHCPTCVKKGSQMPAYRSLSKQTLDRIAAFLAASK